MTSSLLLLLAMSLGYSSGRICPSVNVRNNVTGLASLADCTVVEGFVQIVLMERANETDFEPWSFPELREITQYLLFYRVKGLRSLGKLFPSLVRIGGSSLFIDYGLVVHEMFSLQEVGLASLREISRGSVIVTKNPMLCYVNTVDWGRIARWDPDKNYLAKNKHLDCPGCPDCPRALCWSRTQCQIQPEPHCHPLCVGGCFAQGPKGCNSCRRVLTSEGECVQDCPPGTVQYLNRRCIGRQECTAIDLPKGSTEALKMSSVKVTKYFVFNGTCTDSCPPGYEFDAAGTTCVPCKGGKCQKWCLGKFIENIGQAEMLRGCTHIQGSLEISIRTGKPKRVFEELEYNLGSIEEIDNYLKVFRSIPIVNLKFLKNLKVIHGKSNDSGFGDNYSLLVLENENLQELWDWDVQRSFKIAKGKVFFHYNPKLCPHHIHRLLTVIHHDKNVSNLEVGKDSNGDKFPCNATKIDISVTLKTSNLIQLNVPYLKLNYNITVLRYVIYFTKAQHRNISMFDDLDQCSDDGWRTKDIAVSPSDKQGGFAVNLTDLDPYTQYGFYVTTYTIDRYGAQSSMYYETTLPAKPSEMSNFVAFSNKSSAIYLQWEPPRYINGKLETFVITWTLLQYDETLIRLRNYCIYPIEQTTETLLTNSVAKVVNKEEDCCPAHIKKHVLVGKNGFEKLCSNFEHCPADSDSSITSCESCFNSLVYKSPFRHTGTYNKRNYTKIIKDVKRFKKTNSYPLDIEKPNTSSSSVAGNNTAFTINGVLHFSDYLITIKACRAFDPEESDKSEENRCSSMDLVTVRTRPDPAADSIVKSIDYTISNNSVVLSWKAPVNPNGLIVAYEVEHMNLDNTNPMVTCISSTEYEYSHRRFSIEGLTEGTYKVRVRAVTLAGKGFFSTYVYFRISNTSFSVFYLLLGTIMAFSLIISSVLIFKNAMKIKNLDILVASVNPDYHYIQDEWEIPRENVELISDIGVGAFGKVYRGLLKPNNIPCAVKTVNDDATAQDTFVFLSEASVMKSVSKANYIVRLLGVVSIGRPPLVVMELMELGDLKNHLRSSRDSTPLSTSSLISMALQIADGMTFMEAKKYVHRDLAARNCMVNKELVVKVGDFGMTRDIYETDYYRKNNMGLLPIRWMAPESLKDGVFTSQSDVWSYGVVLWEILTMAEQPYQGSSNDQVLQEVIAGRKLDTPTNCPEVLRDIMLSCWKTKPSLRMKFMQIVTSLEYYHDEEFRKVSYYYTQEAKDLRRSYSEYVEMRPLEEPLLGSPALRPEDGPVGSRPGSVSVLLSKVKSFGHGDRLSRIEEQSSEYQIYT